MEIVYSSRAVLYVRQAHTYLRRASGGICVAGCLERFDWLMMCGSLCVHGYVHEPFMIDHFHLQSTEFDLLLCSHDDTVKGMLRRGSWTRSDRNGIFIRVVKRILGPDSESE